MRNLVTRSVVILGIGLSAGLPATPSAPAATLAAAHCTKAVVQVNGVDKAACDAHYYNYLVPECNKRRSAACMQAANQWYADCLSGKVPPPCGCVSDPMRPENYGPDTPAVLGTAG